MPSRGLLAFVEKSIFDNSVKPREKRRLSAEISYRFESLMAVAQAMSRFSISRSIEVVRELLAIKEINPSCNSCHELINLAEKLADFPERSFPRYL